MAYLASLTIAEAQALLNDVAGSTYTTTKLMPFLKRAYEELETNLNLNEIPVTLEKSAPIVVGIGVTSVPLPADMLLPVWMQERAAGESTYIPMIPTLWEPDLLQDMTLKFWTWREEAIQLVGATSAREVQIIYLKKLAALVDGTSNIVVTNANNFLAAKTAEMAARYVKKDIRAADALRDEAGRALNILIKIAVKGNQLMPVRRIPFGTSRRLFKRYMG